MSAEVSSDCGGKVQSAALDSYLGPKMVPAECVAEAVFKHSWRDALDEEDWQLLDIWAQDGPQRYLPSLRTWIENNAYNKYEETERTFVKLLYPSARYASLYWHQENREHAFRAAKYPVLIDRLNSFLWCLANQEDQDFTDPAKTVEYLEKYIDILKPRLLHYRPSVEDYLK